MSKPKKYVEEIKNLAFSNETLRIKKNDIVEYFVAKYNQPAYNSLYHDVQRFFILQIQEVDVESPSLYQNQSFCYRFREAGIYTVYCLNYPKMRQTVLVEGRESVFNSTTDLKYSEITSQVSLTGRNSIFQESEDHPLSCLNHSNEQEFNEISECLHLIKEGCPAFSIKSKFTELFEYNDKQKSNEVLGESEATKNKVPGTNQPNHDKNASKIANIVSEKSEDLFKVHQLNKLNPDNLFVLLTKLKTTYIKEDEEKSTMTFKSFDDLALYCKKTYKRSPPKSNFNNRAVINRALANINRRFN